MAEELEVKGGLLGSKEAYIEKKAQEITEGMDTVLAHKEKQAERAKALLHDHFHHLPKEKQREYSREVERAIKEMTSWFKVSANEHVKGREGDTFQSILGLSDELLLWIYSVGHRLSTEKRHEDALAIFRLLTMLNPLVADYYVAQGITERALGQSHEALYSFALASLVNPHHPIARYNSAEIYLESHKGEDARIEFEVLEEIIHTGKYAHLKGSVEALRNKLHYKKAS
ncbi:MAG: hypothetical protein FJZ58_04395 [Chlamydiae bacterium]|nr:hypothetical protein [Chlamydiota bacterium]